jgi:apolipoprotein N-acyltransferase
VRNNYVKLFFLGLVSSLAFAPLYLFFIFFYSFFYLLKQTDEENNYKVIFFSGWFFGFGYFIGNCYWYCSSLLIEPLKHGWLVPFAITIIPGYLAIYIALTLLLTKICKKYTNNKFFVTVLFAFFWTILEYLRGIILTGFPWNIIAYSLGFSPLLIQTVSIYGCYVFGFILVIIYSCFYVIIDNKYKLYSLIYVCIGLFFTLFGFFRLTEPTFDYKKYKIRIVQPNIRQEDKLLGDDKITDKLIALALENSDNVDYIILPESALTEYIFYNEYNEIIDILKEKFKDKTIITGAIRIDRNIEKVFNSVLVIKNGKILDYYDKYFLVPFGEFIPFAKMFRSINGTVGLSRAENRNKKIKIDDTFPIFSPNICYESIFSNSVNRDANLIINFTNDAWFGNTSGPYQHFEALKFRAVENSIPAIRVANSGISAVIDNRGRVVVKLKLNRSGVID